MDIMHQAQEIVLPRDPIDFAWKLRSWGMDTSHQGATLVLGYDVLGYMEDWSFSYYFDNFRLIVGLYNIALIGTRISIGNNQYVVIDEVILQTSRIHKAVYQRNIEAMISPANGLFFATMEPRP